MPRPPRITAQGVAYHVLNRRVLRLPLFTKTADYLAFENILAAGLERPDAPHLLAYCLMPNHWHLVLFPRPATNLSTWMQWLTVTHTHRWHQHHHTAGQGPLYQGRFKSFPIQKDHHLLTIIRYVEANPLRAKRVQQAQHWPHSSLPLRLAPASSQEPPPKMVSPPKKVSGRISKPQNAKPLLSPPPIQFPSNWLQIVNRAPDPIELQSLQTALQRNAPYGDPAWAARTAHKLHLQSTQRKRGRPRKTQPHDSLPKKTS